MKPKEIFNVSFNVAKELKKLGYNMPTSSYWSLEKGIAQKVIPKLKLYVEEKDYNNYLPLVYSAPTREEVLYWFRKYFKIFVYIIPRFDGLDGAQYGCHYSIFREGEKEEFDCMGDGTYEYEEAEISAISEVLEEIRSKALKPYK